MTVPETPSPDPVLKSQPPTPRSGERVLAGMAVVIGSILLLAAYSPRFNTRPLDYRPGGAFTYRIDLNRADRSELMQVPGIGPGRADAIIAKRNSDGEYGTPNDLDGVKGFGPKVLEQITPHVIANGTPTTKSTSTGKLKPGDPPIDINTASEPELQRLPGIGPAMAKRIMEARPFTSVDDLDRVRGIGPATMDKLRPFVMVK
jgi:competence protein ComEA